MNRRNILASLAALPLGNPLLRQALPLEVPLLPGTITGLAPLALRSSPSTFLRLSVDATGNAAPLPGASRNPESLPPYWRAEE
jgi:hypothetical protein